MELVGQVYRVKPGLAEEYARRHEVIPQALEELLREAGVRRYAIYLDGETVFTHMEVDDYAAMVERYNDDPVARAWEQEMGGLIEYPKADPQTGWPASLQRVWSL
jgi:L-rhamnose mutarotase